MTRNEKKLLKLYKIIGSDLFKEISMNILPGENIYISSYSGFPTKEMRDQELIKDFWSGLTISELMKKYDLSAQAIYKITECRNREKVTD